MATTFTSSNTADGLNGSSEKRFDIGPDGTLWALVVSSGTPGYAKFFRSTDGGSTWNYSSGSDISFGTGQSTTSPSFFIDADGYAHVAFARWSTDPQVIMYYRGKVTSGSTGWTWTGLTISPASGRIGSTVDVIAFRNGSGWVAWVAYTLLTNDGGVVARVNISSSQVLSVGSTSIGPSTTGLPYQFNSLEFAHTGNGRTPSATPHLFLARNTPGGSHSINLNRAVYSGGTWTWDASVIVTYGQNDYGALTTVWTGSSLFLACAENSGTIQVWEWSGTGTPTARNPPAAPTGTGTVLGLSLACDPATQDLYLVWYDSSDGDIRYSHFTRATNTWSAWAVSVVRTPTGDDGKVQLIKHPTRDSVDMLVAVQSNPWYIQYQQLTALGRTPSAPTLVSPASGAQVDMTNGVTMSWTYNKVSPGDSQTAWSFRRVHSTTTEYWNATSQSWSGTATWNTGSATSVSFAGAAWPSGVTYTWAVATRSATGMNSIYSSDRTVVATSAPTVTMIEPIGLVYGDSTPIVWWDFENSSPQRDYQIRIIPEGPSVDPNSTPPTWDSGVVSSYLSRVARVGIALANGNSYRAYVRCTNTLGVQSAWAYSSFNVAITPPDGPLIEVRDEVDFVTGVPRVRLDLQANSSFLDAAQNGSSAEWEVDANATLADQAADITNQYYVGFTMTSVAAGLMGVRTGVGSPPQAPFGQPQPAGPLSFPVHGGQAYSGVASIRCATTARSGRIRMRWYDANDGTGNLISEDVGNLVVLNNLYYVQAALTATAPPTAVLMRMVIEILTPTAAGEEFYVAFPSLQPGRHQGWQPGGYYQTQTIRVERSDDGGSTWNTIVSRIKPDLAQHTTIDDRLMPFGIDVLYRGYTEVDPGAGAILSSNASLVATLTVDAERWAFRDPLDDAGELYAYVVDWQKADDEQSSVHHPLGRYSPVIDTEGLQAPTGSMDIYVPASDIAFATGVLQRTTVFTIQSPLGTVLTARIIRRKYTINNLRNRIISIDYVEVDA